MQTLLDYRELYALWERQQWAVADLDFTQDATDWQERLGRRWRPQRLGALYSFLFGERHVATELAPIMRAVPREDMRLFLATQHADEARHVVFFRRFLEAIGAEGDDDLVREHTNREFAGILEGMFAERVERLAREPEDLGTLVEAVTIYHMVLEGMVALVAQEVMLTAYTRARRLPGFVTGLELVARDEHRHVAFGARFLADVAVGDPALESAVRRTLDEAVPLGERALATANASAMDQHERLALARTALTRRMQVIGLPWS